MYKKIDLHIHTTCSDGTFSPKEIIDMAIENGLDAIAITDHDSIDAYTKDLFEYANQKGIKLIPGVEMSTRYYGIGIHVLGYNFDINNTQLINALNSANNARINYLTNVSKLLENLGYKVHTDELKVLPRVTKAHIAQDVVSTPQNKDILLKTFNRIPSKGEFIEAIMNEGCPAYTKKYSITPMEAANIIRNANGKVILAHPVCYVYEDNLETDKIFELVKLMNADGIEAHYIFLNKDNINQDESKFWDNYAKSNNFLSTIGSDFHQLDNKHIELGFKGTSFEISQEETNQIMDYLLNKKDC